MSDTRNDKIMPIMGHLRELRDVLIKCAIALAITTAISFVVAFWNASSFVSSCVCCSGVRISAKSFARLSEQGALKAIIFSHGPCDVK